MELDPNCFEVELFLFNPYDKFTEETVRKLNDIMKYGGAMQKILQKAVSKLPGMKWLDRSEHGISTVDEKKQLRVRWWARNRITHSLNQSRSPHAIYFANYGSERFSIEEMKSIGVVIRKEIEDTLYDGNEIVSNIYYSSSFGDREDCKLPWFILERQEKVCHNENNGMWKHIGYVDVKFNSKEKAANYYNKHYPLLRPLNAFGNWCSDWDSDNKFRYVVRRYNGECLNIPPINPKDSEGVDSHI